MSRLWLVGDSWCSLNEAVEAGWKNEIELHKAEQVTVKVIFMSYASCKSLGQSLKVLI